MTIETTKDGNGVTTWKNGGVEQICPFRQPVAIPQQMQSTLAIAGQRPGISLIYHTCDTRCPHLQIQETDNSYAITLTCGGSDFSLRGNKEDGKVVKLKI